MTQPETDEQRRLRLLAEWNARQPLVDRHVATLKRMPDRHARADYLANVERTDGPEIAQRVRVDFGKWFEAEKKRREALKR